jgi:F0F1-type ATP synthase assembly protein I
MRPKWLRGAGVFTGIGLMLGISTALGTWLGYQLDKHWHSSPWFTLLGLFLGMGAGFKELFYLLRRFGGD